MATTAPEQQNQSRADPLHQYKHYQESEDGGSPYAGGSSFRERLAEAVASGMGTVAFIVIATALILVWVFANGAAHYISMTVTNIGKGQQFRSRAVDSAQPGVPEAATCSRAATRLPLSRNLHEQAPLLASRLGASQQTPAEDREITDRLLTIESRASS